METQTICPTSTASYPGAEAGQRTRRFVCSPTRMRSVVRVSPCALEITVPLSTFQDVDPGTLPELNHCEVWASSWPLRYFSGFVMAPSLRREWSSLVKRFPQHVAQKNN